jgi:hypothetical protein
MKVLMTTVLPPSPLSQNNIFISIGKVENNSHQRFQSNSPISTGPTMLEGDIILHPKITRDEEQRVSGGGFFKLVLILLARRDLGGTMTTATGIDPRSLLM